MNILLVHNQKIPALLYGGTERIVYYLGKELVQMGHRVQFLVPENSQCDFAKIIYRDPSTSLHNQIPSDVDIVHFHYLPENSPALHKPYLITQHGNAQAQQELDCNTVFVSKNHAQRHGSHCFVHNGLDWQDYSKPELSRQRNHFHFLGKAAWRVKNVKGAIRVILNTPSETLCVLGGVRFNFSMGLRFTFSPRIHFYGMVGGRKKDELLNGSKGLIFPVRWHEPFGLSIIESLYFGCPVLGTPYGSLPELISPPYGYLSTHSGELTEALLNIDAYDRKSCHEYAREYFNSQQMAEKYLPIYEQVLAGTPLHPINSTLQITSDPKFLNFT